MAAEPRDEATSWTPVGLAAVLADDRPRAKPTLLVCRDGAAMLYPGKLHGFHGETESLKTWIALVAVKQELEAGRRVVYVDFEDAAETIVRDRLHRALGASAEMLIGRLSYVRPTEPATSPKIAALVATGPSLVVVDGVTEAAALHNLNPDKGPDIAKLHQLLTRPFAERGAAVVVIDHVVKDREARGRYSTGSVHKANVLDGASYIFEVVSPARIGEEGIARITVAKDRPGAVQVADRKTRHFADFVLACGEDGRVGWRFETMSPGPFRPTVLMRKISEFLAGQDRAVSQNVVLAGVPGQDRAKRTAIRQLISEGHLASTEGRRNALMLTLVRPFEEAG